MSLQFRIAVKSSEYTFRTNERGRTVNSMLSDASRYITSFVYFMLERAKKETVRVGTGFITCVVGNLRSRFCIDIR